VSRCCSNPLCRSNGTIAPCAALLARVDQWNVSPKLTSGGDSEPQRVVPDALTALRDTNRAWLKLVVEDERDLADADVLVAQLAWPRERVLLMPQAQTREQLAARAPLVAAAALARRYRFSTRLHIELWGGRRGT
jgi:organic radical activating enzyme